MNLLLERIALLKKVHFFAMLRTDQLRQIVPLLEPRGWAQGERVFDKGDLAQEMYIITTGRVGISISDNPDTPQFVAELLPGECFGEMGLLDDLPRSATAHVLEDAEALALQKEKLRGLLLSYPEMGLGMLRALSRRLRGTNAVLAERGAK